MKLAFLGLGVMGYPMAGHLSRAGHAVTVFNRTAPKAARWVEAFGGKAAATPAAAVHGAEIALMCVGNDDDVRSVITGADGALAGMAAGTILVDQGLGDKFLNDQLRPELLEGACRAAGQPLTLRRHAGYDHGYFFIATFMEDHLRHHAAALAA